MIVDKDYLIHISEKPWGDYSESDYTLEQWHAACLIHQHDGLPTSKSQCKLPIKTPNGALNRNGVHAAAAALAGARSPINASADEKAKAAAALRRAYSELGEDPPESLVQHSDFGSMSLDDAIEHFGIRGMHWGVRKDGGTPGVSRKTDRAAAKDASEFARAKMFFGEGAGTRRKLIKSTVDAKSKQNPDYARAFNAHLAKQDMSQHAEKAVSERHRKDVAKTTKRSAGAVARKLTGEMGTTAAFTVAAIAGAAYLKSPKARKFMNDKANSIANSVNRLQGARKVRKLLNL